MLSPEAQARRNRLRSTSILLLCCATSLFAFFANASRTPTDIRTSWDGDTLVVKNMQPDMVLTHLSYFYPSREAMAELPVPPTSPICPDEQCIQEELTHTVWLNNWSSEKRYALAELGHLKWRDHWGAEMPPPQPGTAVRVIYYEGQLAAISRWSTQ